MFNTSKNKHLRESTSDYAYGFSNVSFKPSELFLYDNMRMFFARKKKEREKYIYKCTHRHE